MSFDLEPEQEVEITYKGIPNHADSWHERTLWTRFRIVFAKAVKPLCDLAGSILKVELENRAATVNKKQSEAALNMAQAKKLAAETAEIAARLDQTNAKTTKAIHNVETMSIEELRAALGDEFAEWLAKAERLRLLYGTEIKLTKNQPEIETVERLQQAAEKFAGDFVGKMVREESK